MTSLKHTFNETLNKNMTKQITVVENGVFLNKQKKGCLT